MTSGLEDGVDDKGMTVPPYTPHSRTSERMDGVDRAQRQSRRKTEASRQASTEASRQASRGHLRGLALQ